MSVMTESLESAGNHLVETCSEDLAVYKRAVKTLDSQAVRRLVESIIAQKTDQLNDLKAVTGSPEGSIATGTTTESVSAAGTAAETWPDIESLLKEITAREQALAQATSALAAEAGSEEHRSTLNACAERSRKFASWTQDHLDLLGLF
jgi:hypothetical protein